MIDEESERRLLHAVLSQRQDEVSDLGAKVHALFLEVEPVIALGAILALIVNMRTNFLARPQGDRTFCWFVEQALDIPIKEIVDD